MSDKEEDLRKLFEQKEEINALKEQHEKTRKEYLEKYNPYLVDRIYNVTGCWFDGTERYKDKGYCFKVVLTADFEIKPYFRKVKKDGTASLHNLTLYCAKETYELIE
jgi:hypothetical protein